MINFVGVMINFVCIMINFEPNFIYERHTERALVVYKVLICCILSCHSVKFTKSETTMPRSPRETASKWTRFSRISVSFDAETSRKKTHFFPNFGEKSLKISGFYAFLFEE